MTTVERFKYVDTNLLKTVEDVLEANKEISSVIGEYRSTLQSFRGINWRDGIERDTRAPIQLLNTELQRLESIQKASLSTEIITIRADNDNFPTLSGGDPLGF